VLTRLLGVVALAIALGVAGVGQASGAVVKTRVIGGLGTGAGRFNDPVNAAVGPKGRLYVTDALNNRVQEFTSTGTFIRAWGWGVATGASAFQICTHSCHAGLQGSGNGQFNFPFGVTVGRHGNVYVTDNSNERVEEFSPAGSFIRTWGSAGAAAGQFNGPTGIAAVPGGHLLVVDKFNARVQEFNSAGTFIRAWGWGVATGASALEVCTSVCQAGIPGSGNGQFDHPDQVALNAAGRIFVTDTDNVRVEKFTPALAYVAKFGGKHLIEPRGLSIDPAGNVYVADEQTQRIEKFTGKGRFLLHWGGRDLKFPIGVVTPTLHRVYAIDDGHNRFVEYMQTP
jgi:tripartite motif-containing protein 71